MGNINVCTICGSSDIVSDRSLGGKMVCSRCGSSSLMKKSFNIMDNKSILSQIGNTPLIKLKQASELTGCNI